METINVFILKIIELFGNLETLLAVIVGFAIAAIAAYKQIMHAINEKKLFEAAAPLIGQAEVEPKLLFHSLVDKPALNSIGAITNEDKNNIVVQALKEREPKLLKKMKLNDVLQIGNWVSGAYSFIKPLVKSLKK